MSTTEKELTKANKRLNNMKNLLEKYDKKIKKVEDDCKLEYYKEKYEQKIANADENDPDADSSFDEDFLNYLVAKSFVNDYQIPLVLREHNLEHRIEQQAAKCKKLKEKLKNNK